MMIGLRGLQQTYPLGLRQVKLQRLTEDDEFVYEMLKILFYYIYYYYRNATWKTSYSRCG